jgi:hypothetical protein
MPAGVVFPKNADDIGETIRFAQRNELGLIPRAAEAIGQTLSKRQRPNGSWPFQVDPKTEKVIEE